MRSLAELLQPGDAGAEEVRRLLAHAKNPVEVIRGDRARGERALVRVQADTSTPLGGIAYRLGGLVFDHGWLRLLGAGAESHPRDLADWNGPAEAPRLAGATLVADDVVGGFFAVNGGAFAGPPGGVWYFAPDTLGWEEMEVDYRGLLEWACDGELDAFYAEARWPDWTAEMTDLRVDQAFEMEPPPSVESKTRTRLRVDIEAPWQQAARAVPDARR